MGKRFISILLSCTFIVTLLAACGPRSAGLNDPAVQPLVPTAQIARQPGDPTAINAPTAVSQPAVAPTALPMAQPGAATAMPIRQGPGGLPYPLRLPELNFGVVGHLYYTDRGTALGRTREAGFNWFRQQVHWRDIEDRSGQFFWGELDNIVADVNARGLLLMINVTRSPAWHTDNGGDGLPNNPEALGRFVGAMAQRYKGRVHAIKIWNEQNLAYENGGPVTNDSAGRYVEALVASYNAIKAADPSIIVVSGAPASTATTDPNIAMDTISYLKAIYSYDNGKIRDFFDVQAFHPGGAANPPDTLWPDNPSAAPGWNDDASFYFRHLENQRRVMEEFGLGNHQVWVTEYGWATQNTSPGFEYGNLISFETQRDYLVGAIRYTHDNYPWVSNMFLWNLNFAVLKRENNLDTLHEQASFSIFNPDWSPRPAFFGVQQTISALRGN
ncbi:MAG: cellulase family glycosylhydrolase [Chloroflexaceae bacterium]|jgi:hypothetical protein|nr:cellulase family glycosylhydrolase [Chloroflexaceae bacterium]